MLSVEPIRAGALLPLLLTVPPGAIVGVPADLLHGLHLPQVGLAAFGPRVGTACELRHAVSRVPPRIILDIDRIPLPMVEAALPALSLARAAVVLQSEDRGLLARLGELVLHRGANGMRWIRSRSVWAGRALDLLVLSDPAGRPQWIRMTLQREEGAEAVLSAVRARGLQVCESRITYRMAPAR